MAVPPDTSSLDTTQADTSQADTASRATAPQKADLPGTAAGQLAHPHDSGYKYLFSNKDIFCQLLTRFVDEPLFRHLRPEDVEQLEHSFISDEFLNRESDIIYKVKLPESGTPARRAFYIYVLLEFQSSADKSIPVRMLLYLLQFYDLLLRNSRKGLLPAVFPLLLYNGKEPWKVAGNVHELIEHTIPEKYLPSFAYHIIEERRIPEERLKKMKGAAAAIMLCEQQNDREGLDKALRDIVQLVAEEKPEVRRMLSNWLKKIFLSTKGTDDWELNRLGKNLEEPEMLVDVVRDILKQEREAGERLGEARGETRGETRGKERSTWQLARRMHSKGYPIAEIADLTGISEEKLRISFVEVKKSL
jgi:predicted transposase/invertase (TIGR01784 family)